MIEHINLERYKRQMDEDFETFPVNKRLIQLEKSWIKNVSHSIMPTSKYFIHIDRKELRKELLKYLKKKRKEFDKRGTFPDES